MVLARGDDPPEPPLRTCLVAGLGQRRRRRCARPWLATPAPGRHTPGTPGAHPLSRGLRSASPARLRPALVGNPCARSAHPRNPRCAPALVVGLGQLRWIREADGTGEANSRVWGPSAVRDHGNGVVIATPIP